ncbi:hypothetical protein [Flavisphingomonas formosensis]|uniref:hypothetical protein n=1 Tax=Flavisphingomonas formosensis TaxID=861534 RepID=UPI0012FB8F8E|nr:hypothetical protein [Sphingomonas formosensis]
MIGKILGALAGRKIDRRDGGSGITGALIGAAVAGLARRAAMPIGLAMGGGYLAKKMIDKRREDKRLADSIIR